VVPRALPGLEVDGAARPRSGAAAEDVRCGGEDVGPLDLPRQRRVGHERPARVDADRGRAAENDVAARGPRRAPRRRRDAGGRRPKWGGGCDGSGGSGTMNIVASVASKPMNSPVSYLGWAMLMSIGPTSPGPEKVISPNGSVRPFHFVVAGSPIATKAIGTPSPVKSSMTVKLTVPPIGPPPNPPLIASEVSS